MCVHVGVGAVPTRQCYQVGHVLTLVWERQRGACAGMHGCVLSPNLYHTLFLFSLQQEAAVMLCGCGSLAQPQGRVGCAAHRMQLSLAEYTSGKADTGPGLGLRACAEAWRLCACL